GLDTSAQTWQSSNDATKIYGYGQTEDGYGYGGNNSLGVSANGSSTDHVTSFGGESWSLQELRRYSNFSYSFCTISYKAVQSGTSHTVDTANVSIGGSFTDSGSVAANDSDSSYYGLESYLNGETLTGIGGDTLTQQANESSTTTIDSLGSWQLSE